MSAQAISNNVDRAVFDAQCHLIEFRNRIDAIADEYRDTNETMWRRRLALEIHYLREEIKRRA